MIYFMNKRKRGFTLIELLIVVAIIGILATVVLASLGAARLKARDAAIISRLSSIRTDIELNYPEGNYTGLCSSTLYSDLEIYISSQGGSVNDCSSDANSYRIAAYDATGNQSSFGTNLLSTNIAHAQPEGELEEGPLGEPLINGYCVNSFGASLRIDMSALRDVTGGNFCTLEEQISILGESDDIRNTCATISVNGSIVNVPTGCYNYTTFSVEPSSSCVGLPPTGGCR